MAISTPGIGSGLDVNSIVSQLMTIERQPVTLLDKKEASYQTQLTSLGTLKGAVSAFQTAVQGLADITKFQSMNATPADATVLTASSTTIATAGSYSIDVTTLAQSQKLVAAGQSTVTAAIGGGASTTLSFDFGTISGGTLAAGTYTGASFATNGAGVKTVTIDSSNNSLSGIKDAINNAKIGVTASIVNDGGTSPYRLVLSSDNMGKSNSIKLSVSGDATLAGLLSNDPGNDTGQKLSESVTGQNADFKVNGVAISKTSNSISDVVHGVSFNLLKAGSTTLSVSQNTSSVAASVNAFATAYNDLNTTIASLTSYDPKTNVAGPLNGDSTVRSIQTQIRRALSNPIAGLSGTYTTLGQIGVSFQKDGSIAVDSTKLQSAINTNFKDIAGLFASAGKTTDSLVSYTSSSAKTKPGSYALNVTQLATQGNAVGAAAAGLTIDNTNNTLTMMVDGTSLSVTLGSGTYASADALAAEVQAKINGVSALSSAGGSVAVTQSGGVLSITSNRYGSASSVASIGGNGASNLLGGSTSTTGVDVAGTIGGAVAIGSGQVLTGGNGSSAEGLRVSITGGITGSRGTVNFSQGYAYQLDKLTATLMSSSGPISSSTDGINRSITDIGKRRDTLNTRLVSIEARYRAQFTSLDTLISSMTKTSTFLTQQLASISANSKA